MKLTVAIFLAAILDLCCGARILAVFLYPGKSHFVVFQPMLEALAKRGHEVVVLSHFPLQQPLANYTDISFEGTIPLKLNALSIRHMKSLPDHHVFIDRIWGEAVRNCDIFLRHSNMQHLIHSSNEKFDLLITEIFGSNCFLGFAHKFKVPIVSVTSTLPFPWNTDPVGNPVHPFAMPNDILPVSESRKFRDRVVSMLYWIALRLGFTYYSDIPSDTIARKYFGEDMPPLWDIASNVSLLLTNTHFITHQPRPLIPAVVEVGGIHITEPKPLPKDLQKFLDEAPHGVIYFSMGSMIRTETLHDDKRQALVEAFSQLPQRVLWKWEGDTPPSLSANVRTGKWMPQLDILNHPNVQVFLGHGGLLGIMEALHYGVPMVGVPIYGDQGINMRALVSRGMAVILDYHSLTKDSVLDALRTVLNNASYHNTAKRLSQIFHDRRTPPLETAVELTELVLSSRGALPMRSEMVGVPWYQYLLLDVITCFLLIIVVLLFFFYKLTTGLVLLYCHLRSSKASLQPKYKRM